MTTVTVKDNIVACDSQLTNGYTISSLDGEKVVKINGCIVAGAGSYAQIIKFRQWFTEHSDVLIAQQDNPTVNIPLPQNLQEGDFTGAVLYPEGDLYVYEGRTDVAIKFEQPWAMGSGSDFALAAMKAGKSAKGAVEVAIDLDVFSGGEVKTYELDEEYPELTKEYLETLSKDEIIQELFGNEDSEQETLTINIDECDDIGQLKLLADNLELKYPHNIGIEKLRSKIRDFLESDVDNVE
jgi:ATP-dependent protease HslVU (ClpYQ) peptidase subunit